MITNREVFLKDPTTTTIPNSGVAKVGAPETPEQWAVLRYELQSFVCDGEYERGLERILHTYLSNLTQAEQPAVWVSGFYGSGKSHFVRVLEYLWRDITFPDDGASARGLTKLPPSIREHLTELTTVGRREGGLWSAAGTLGAGAGDSVRLAMLGIVFDSAGLPTAYAPARLVIWLKQNGRYEAVERAIEARGKRLAHEPRNMYVSPVLAQALLETIPDLAPTPAGVLEALRKQYPRPNDISDEEMLDTLQDVLTLQSSAPGKLPCALLVFDELQQFIGDDGARTLQVQNVVEACSSRFGSRLLFVATGQAALQATPQLSRLQGRFTARVTLSDKDVEQVVREVVLRKAPDKTLALQDVLDRVSGEIDRHLVGTRIGATPADRADLVPDYPLLPARRRFWESVLRAVDSAGLTGQLRTQLRIVHETTREIADRPLGWVVAGDMIFEQLKSDMLMSSVLLREVAQTIEGLDDGTPEGELRSRLCATIFLIGNLPTEGIAAPGLRATIETLADLLVEDLANGGPALRQRIPAALTDLVERGTLMLVADEYRLQTRESAEWQADYRARLSRIRADDSRIASDRATELRNAVGLALKGITLMQGASRTARKHEIHFGAELPTIGASTPVWVRDEWSVSERAAREEAQAAGVDSPIVTLWLPRRDPEALRQALASYAAAQETVATRPVPSTPEGMEARTAMQSRAQLERRKLDGLIGAIVAGGRVFQGGGNEVAEGSLQASARAAIEAALARLFPEFAKVDHPAWGAVVRRAGEGSGEPLAPLGHTGDVAHHPACAEARTFLGAAGKKGAEVRRHFLAPPYGWPQDAVDGALLALTAIGAARASHNGQPVTVKQITQSRIGVVDFASEGVTISAGQRIGMRSLCQAVGVPCVANDEAAAVPALLARLRALADEAGGEAPLPRKPGAAQLQALEGLGGNERFAAIVEQRQRLQQDAQTWSEAREKSRARLPRWQTLHRLLRHAENLPVAETVRPQVEAIQATRSLLADPDPLAPLLDSVAGALRVELQALRGKLADERDTWLRWLEEQPEWRQIEERDRNLILQRRALTPVPDLAVGDDEALLRTLDATPLAAWRDRLLTLPSRATGAREEAAKLLQPEAVLVRPKAATLTSVDEATAYLDALRDEIVGHLVAGRPVILS